MPTFATAEQLRIHLGLDSIDTARADQLLEKAESAIRDEAKQTIDHVADDVAELDGVWSHTLRLPERPVTDVSAVSLRGPDGITTTITDYVFSRNGKLRRTGSSSQRIPGDVGRWGGPDSEVTVTYSHGYQTIPQELTDIAIAVAARAWINPGGVQSEGVGTWSSVYGIGSALRPGELNDREARTCRKYRPRT